MCYFTDCDDFPLTIPIVRVRFQRALAVLRLRDIPNLITVIRLLLAAPITWLLLERRYQEALLWFIIAGVSDLADGFLAKRYGWTSQLGRVLDPLADKALLVGTMLVLGWQNDLPVWLVVLAVGRDGLLVTLGTGYHYLIEPIKPKPLLISKINTLLQLALVTLVLLSKVLPLPGSVLQALIYATAVTTLWSGGAYLWKWGRRAVRKSDRSHVA